MASPPVKSLRGVLQWLRARWWRMGLAVALIALVVARASAPVLLERVIEDEATRALGRVVDVGDVELSLLQGRVGLSRVHAGPILDGRPALRPLPAGDVRLGANRVWLDVAVGALLQGEVRVEDLTIEGPRLLRLRDAAGHLPPLLAGAAPPEDSDETGAPPPPIALDRLQVTQARFFYYDVANPDRQPLEIGVGQLLLRGVALADGELVVAQLEIREPTVRVLSDFEATELDEDAESASPDAPSDPDDVGNGEPAEALAIRIGEVTLRDASFSLLADAQRSALEMTLELRATDVTLAAGEGFPLEATLQVAGGSVDLKGQAGISPARFEGDLQWKEIDLGQLVGAAGERAPLQVSSGVSEGALEVSLELGDASQLDLSGNVAVAGLAAGDAAGLEIGWQQLAVEVASLAIDLSGEKQPDASLASVVLTDPRVSVARSAEPVATEAEPVEEPVREEGPRVRIATLEVSGGVLDFEDTSVTPAHRSALRDLSVSGRDLRWPEGRAGSLKVEALSSEDSQFSANATHADEKTGVELVLAGVGLPAFSPYIADAAGYWIDEGRADLEARVTLHGERAVIDSDLVLHRLAVTSVKPGTFQKRFGVSLDVALALLRDPRGDIRVPIDFIVEGEESRLDFGSLLVASLRQALVGALSTPLKGISLLLPKGDESGSAPALAPLAFHPGETALSPTEDISGLAELLAARPGLGLRVRGGIGDADAAGLAERLLTARILADEKLPPVEAGILQRRRIEAALEARSRGESGELSGEDASVLDRWLSQVEIGDDDRAAFARERAEAVRTALIERDGVDASRLEIGDQQEGVVGVAIELAPVSR